MKLQLDEEQIVKAYNNYHRRMTESDLIALEDLL